MDQEQDHPLLPDRLISTKTILSFNQAMCIGIPLERALRKFEKDAELGSNIGSYSLYDYQRFYLKPLFKAIEKTVQNRVVLVCDETLFDCLWDQGRGKIQAAGVDPKAKTNYVVAVTTPTELQVGNAVLLQPESKRRGYRQNLIRLQLQNLSNRRLQLIQDNH